MKTRMVDRVAMVSIRTRYVAVRVTIVSANEAPAPPAASLDRPIHPACFFFPNMNMRDARRGAARVTRIVRRPQRIPRRERRLTFRLLLPSYRDQQLRTQTRRCKKKTR